MSRKSSSKLFETEFETTLTIGASAVTTTSVLTDSSGSVEVDGERLPEADADAGLLDLLEALELRPRWTYVPGGSDGKR